jgi:fructuronate reductase
VRLSAATVDRLPQDVARFSYERGAQSTGIVHFGIGAFHRAHQAVYTDDAMNAGDRNWAITGVSLRSGNVAAQTNPQDGLYTVSGRSAESDATRLIGSVCNIVSLTVTEKGYCRTPDGALDRALAEDGSLYAYLSAAFRRRYDAGLAGLTLISCDNLADNGAQLSRLIGEYLDPDLARWFDAECACPSTMVDRIVPATSGADRDAVARQLGVRDEAAIITEPFSQWVIENRFAGPRPRWEAGGAQFTDDVRAFETAKLRMLNGAHSALAYLGLARGYEYVHQAIADPALAAWAETLMRDEAATSLTPAPGQDLDAYAAALIARFRNPALNHKLVQIAMDGSQKIPQRWLETLAFHKKAGRNCPAILTALAAWIVHIRGDARPVDDPLADDLRGLWEKAGTSQIIDALFGENALLSSCWTADADAHHFMQPLLA